MEDISVGSSTFIADLLEMHIVRKLTSEMLALRFSTCTVQMFTFLPYSMFIATIVLMHIFI